MTKADIPALFKQERQSADVYSENHPSTIDIISIGKPHLARESTTYVGAKSL
jgi:hypothetical protein